MSEKQIPPRTCPICGELFQVSEKSRRETCSMECQIIKAERNGAGRKNNVELTSEEIWNRAAFVRANGIYTGKEWW